MTGLAGVVVAITGIWLVGFAVCIAFAPGRAERFLAGFASSARAHYLEQSIRMLAGVALVLVAPEARFSELLRGFGWVIVVTTAGLFVTPWRWHHRFAQWAIPLATRHLRLYGVGSLLLGLFLLYAIWPR